MVCFISGDLCHGLHQLFWPDVQAQDGAVRVPWVGHRHWVDACLHLRHLYPHCHGLQDSHHKRLTVWGWWLVLVGRFARLAVLGWWLVGSFARLTVRGWWLVGSFAGLTVQGWWLIVGSFARHTQSLHARQLIGGGEKLKIGEEGGIQKGNIKASFCVCN